MVTPVNHFYQILFDRTYPVGGSHYYNNILLSLQSISQSIFFHTKALVRIGLINGLFISCPMCHIGQLMTQVKETADTGERNRI